jgi:Zn-dependent protease/predicted transcriptional regulator
MSWSIKLFRIKGIEVKIHLTFLLILAWAAYRWGISQGQGLEGALFGVVVTLLLFVCVTLHELGHSFQALRFGVPVKDITLWPFGGLAQIERIPEDPKQELRIAIAGPSVNLAVALILILLSRVFDIQGWMGVDRLYQALGDVSWEGLLAYLVTSNLTLALFNLVPAFPMDGGRVLRALLALRLDYSRATALAVSVGQGLAWLLGLYGVISGSWTLAIIAVFVYVGAGQEGRMVEVKNVLGQMQVRQAMSLEVQTLAPTDPLSVAVDLTLQSFQTDYPVLDDGRLVGLLCQDRLLAVLKQRGTEVPVRETMRTEFPVATPDEALFEVQERMSSARLHAIPVVIEGRLVGLLTAQDINEAYRLLSASPMLVESVRA